MALLHIFKRVKLWYVLESAVAGNSTDDFDSSGSWKKSNCVTGLYSRIVLRLQFHQSRVGKDCRASGNGQVRNPLFKALSHQRNSWI